MTEPKTMMPHQLILEEKSRLSRTGVTGILSFDEACAVVETTLGQLTVEGQHLHIQKSDVETGDLVMDGQVNALSYKPLKKGGDGLLTRLLK